MMLHTRGYTTASKVTLFSDRFLNSGGAIYTLVRWVRASAKTLFRSMMIATEQETQGCWLDLAVGRKVEAWKINPRRILGFRNASRCRRDIRAVHAR